jgi:hypothetical protein
VMWKTAWDITSANSGANRLLKFFQNK